MMTRKNQFGARLLAVIGLGLGQAACQSVPEFYSAEDYYRVEKIDAHVHLNTRDTALVDQAIADHFKLLTVNVDYPDFPLLAEQREVSVALRDNFPETVSFAATFSMNGWQQPAHVDQVIQQLSDARQQGAVAVKVWKNIGMDVRDAQGRILMVDDPRLDPVFDFLESTGFPMIGHQGEPHNCWLPLDEMTVTNDREYFRDHPQYHMFLHPEMPSYEDQMNARDQRLRHNPGLVFAGAHLASLEWSVERMAAFLDEFPEAKLDMAARMGQVQYQSRQDRDRVREFLIKYQDRLMYATDLTHESTVDGEVSTIAAEAHQRWMAEWLYLTSDQVMTAPEVEGEFTGLKLPRDVINKIYYSNAARFLEVACSTNPTAKGCMR